MNVMIIKKIKGVHIPGRRQMSLVNNLENYLNPKFVYIPLTNGNVLYRQTVSFGDVVKKGQVIALREDRFGHPVHSPVSGTVLSIKKVWHASGKMVDSLEIENNYKEETVPEFGRSLDLDNLTKTDIIERIKSCGLIGMGGAGFPTYVKYMLQKKMQVFIVNAAECEPYLTSDDISISTKTDELIRGIKYALIASGAPKAVICIKKTKVKLIKLLTDKLVNHSNISLFELADFYPAGWERVQVERVTGKKYNSLPSEVGAVVDNAQTVIAICEAVEQNKPLIERVITVAGEGLVKSQNFYVKIGTRCIELIEKLGGYTEGLNDAFLIAGGPMTGRAIFDDAMIISSSLGGITVIPKKKSLEQACLGCGKCSLNCPSFLTPTEIRFAYECGDFASLEKLNTLKCVQCGLCSYVCPSRISMTEIVGKAQDSLRKYRATKVAKKG